jgi:hypothetical protein
VQAGARQARLSLDEGRGPPHQPCNLCAAMQFLISALDHQVPVSPAAAAPDLRRTAPVLAHYTGRRAHVKTQSHVYPALNAGTPA